MALRMRCAFPCHAVSGEGSTGWSAGAPLMHACSAAHPQPSAVRLDEVLVVLLHACVHASSIGATGMRSNVGPWAMHSGTDAVGALGRHGSIHTYMQARLSCMHGRVGKRGGGGIR